MFKKVAIAAAIAAMSVGAQAVVIDFEDVVTAIGAQYGTGTSSTGATTYYNNSILVTTPDGYAGFTWSEGALPAGTAKTGTLQLWDDSKLTNKVAALGGLTDAYGSASVTAPLGTFTAAVNDSNQWAQFASKTGNEFSFEGITLVMGKASTSTTAGVMATIRGYKDGVEVATWLNPSKTGGYAIGDQIVLNSTALFAADADFASVDAVRIEASKGIVLFDNITAVPEPSTYAMLLAGLGMMGVIARRRTRA